MIMRLVRKNTKNNIIKAVTKVSGYNEEELKESKQHSVTSWVHLGIYVANEAGMTIEDAAGLFGRHFATGHASIKKVKKKFPQVEDEIKEIVATKMKLDIES
tara:strand:- start:118 stop:423 length:306 start_codon:yes stop_codon:yes gene_type:complete